MRGRRRITRRVIAYAACKGSNAFTSISVRNHADGFVVHALRHKHVLTMVDSHRGPATRADLSQPDVTLQIDPALTDPAIGETLVGKSVTAWKVLVGSYLIECSVLEKPRGTFTITIEENGQLLHREVINGSGPTGWEISWRAAAQLREANGQLILRSVRSQWARGDSCP
jgi:hypothetical protein